MLSITNAHIKSSAAAAGTCTEARCACIDARLNGERETSVSSSSDYKRTTPPCSGACLAAKPVSILHTLRWLGVGLEMSPSRPVSNVCIKQTSDFSTDFLAVVRQNENHGRPQKFFQREQNHRHFKKLTRFLRAVHKLDNFAARRRRKRIFLRVCHGLD